MTGPGIGHNSGREPPSGWRRHCWAEARRRLLPTLPIEVVRLRVARARELGLDYRTYASVRAASGHDVIAFLFSSNALRVLRPGAGLPEDRATKLAALSGCGRIVLAQPPLEPARLAATIAARHGLAVEAAAAPAAFAPWGAVGRQVRAALAPGRLPPDGVLLVGDTAFEREWAAAGRLAGYLPAERYFPTGS